MRLVALVVLVVLAVVPGCERSAERTSPTRVLSQFVGSWASMSRAQMEDRVDGDGAGAELFAAVASLEAQGVTRFSVATPAERGDGTVTAGLRLHFQDGGQLATSIRATVRDGKVVATPSLLSAELSEWQSLLVVETAPSGARGIPVSTAGRPLVDEESGQRPPASPELADAVSLIERSLDPVLAGAPGRRLETGRGAALAESEPSDHDQVRTSLDDELQQHAAAALADRPGALVVLAPDGRIRALVANRHPSEPDRSPAADDHLPGSTFKIVTLVAAAQAGALDPDQTIACPAQLAAGTRLIRNFEGEGGGDLSLRDAFAQSCNTAFARIGITLGPRRLIEATRDLGIDGTGVAGAAASHLTAPQVQAELAAFAIGASNVSATPLAMGGIVATMASGGRRVTPRWDDAPVPPGRRVLTRDDAAEIVSMMEDVVESGTGRRAAIEGEVLAGKTGTAVRQVEGGSVDDAWFLAIAPSRHPRLLVVCYLPRAGVGGQEAAPLVRDFLVRSRSKWTENH